MASAADRKLLDKLLAAVRIAKATCTCNGGVRIVMRPMGELYTGPTEVESEPCEAHGPVKTVVFYDPTVRPPGYVRKGKPVIAD
jgi:hypothetical protein